MHESLSPPIEALSLTPTETGLTLPQELAHLEPVVQSVWDNGNGLLVLYFNDGRDLAVYTPSVFADGSLPEEGFAHSLAYRQDGYHPISLEP